MSSIPPPPGSSGSSIPPPPSSQPGSPWSAPSSDAPVGNYSAGNYPVGGYPQGQAYRGSSPQMTPTNYANFGQRLAALFVDGIVNVLITLPLSVPGVWMIIRSFADCTRSRNMANEVVISCGPGQLKGGMLAAGIVLCVVAGIVAAVVFCKLLGRGQSIGMKMVGIRLADASSGLPVGGGRAFGWWIAHIVSGFALYLGYFWMLWDPRRQCWHDKIANTVVLRA